eukprot:TRINITY_DN1990_c0_g3_i1.p1 TRINITY_DN1990_c0_g3~~TRINITY_DN1990_c0_g3_i1.p1  ORF type:complete len:334 (+),score=53.40 TRINITY_DN1990_c0_g3_i1:62-1063(+)
MKPFSLDGSYYDTETYMGRVMDFYSVIDPRKLFVSSKKVTECQELINDYKNNKFSSEDLLNPSVNAQLWSAKSTLGAVLHPDTGEPISTPFRAGAFIPANVPISAGMLLTAPTVVNSMFWQWVNQSYNAGFNYANRPITVGEGATDDALASTLAAYTTATAVSCSLAVGLNQWLKKATLSPAMAKRLGIAVPFVAVGGAGAFNVVAMRYKEAIDGIPVLHPETGAELGKSCAVAKTALGQCALSRIVLPAPVLLLPPFLLPVARSLAPKLAGTFAGKAAIDLMVLTCALSVALPFAIALFPQKGTFPVASLEEGLRKIAEEEKLEVVRFNKGL